MHFAAASRKASDGYPFERRAHLLEYITGDRFSPEFIEKRRSSLECYLTSIARHPILQTSVSLRRFLESSDIVSLFSMTDCLHSILWNTL